MHANRHAAAEMPQRTLRAEAGAGAACGPDLGPFARLGAIAGDTATTVPVDEIAMPSGRVPEGGEAAGTAAQLQSQPAAGPAADASTPGASAMTVGPMATDGSFTPA